VNASVNDTVKSEANGHESDTPYSTEDPTLTPPAGKEKKRKSSWFKRGKRSSVVKPVDKYGKYLYKCLLRQPYYYDQSVIQLVSQ